MNGALFIVFIIFLTMKLSGTIDWSWWYVTMPLWIEFVIAVAVFVVAAVSYVVIAVTKEIHYIWKTKNQK